MSGRGDGGALVQVERRRNWSDEEKLAILKETTVPGVVISAVARRHGIGTGQLYTWRRRQWQRRRQCTNNHHGPLSGGRSGGVACLIMFAVAVMTIVSWLAPTAP